MRTSLFELDLTPLSETIVDLLGMSVPETFAPFGTCHGTKLANWTPELGAALKEAYDAAEKVVKGAKRPELAAFLVSRGKDARAEEKRGSLRSRCMIAINEARSPVRFVNAALNEWICGCGHTGPATFDGRAPKCGGEGCTRPSYLMRLTRRAAA